MKGFFKNKVVSIIILIATIILAGIAVFTAIRLYQLRQESVSPNAPSSKPAAATNPPGAGALQACRALEFTLGGSVCTMSASPTSLSMQVGEKKSVLITVSGDTAVLDLAPKDATIANITKKTTQSCLVAPCPVSFEITALKVGSTTLDAGTDATCKVAVAVTVLGTGTTPPATATPTSTPISCNNTCSTTANCQSGLICSGGACRHPNCTSETDCDCTVATSSPTTPPAGTSAPGTQATLPPTGSSLPTILGAGLGILVILGAALLLI